MKKRVSAIAVVFVCILLCILIYILFRYQNTSPKRLPDRYPIPLQQTHSLSDKDQDGIDDQRDILQGALNYIASRPKYKSKYYQTGYPDDEYGVCTDVVANALKNAGYDLMTLVQEDIQNNPEDYAIDNPDKNIDFRRVRNLTVYFAHSALSLTVNVYDLEEWQGGDIVIFQHHIGIVSDHRNKSGVPYIIHHNDPWQKSYEQDILETRNDIVAHYRMAG
ncbi:MAG: DUF1287 domain-containing protein [Ruminococcus sp.]|jgi:uncharacterized protein YijF (DUF1287 family)